MAGYSLEAGGTANGGWWSLRTRDLGATGSHLATGFIGRGLGMVSFNEECVKGWTTAASVDGSSLSAEFRSTPSFERDI